MRLAVLSDVHANLEALQAVLEDARADRIVVLGDLVGYNADPQAVLDLLHDIGATAIAGNHDLAALGRFHLDWFNDLAREALLWTVRQLNTAALARLMRLKPAAREGTRLLVHGSVRDPVMEYLTNPAAAAASFAADPTFDVGFFGHTHIPAAYVALDDTAIGLDVHEPLRLNQRKRYLLNPGSVGQPRDGNPDASYLLLEDDLVIWRRVPYDLATTQRKILAAGLQPLLAARLEAGW